MKITVKKSVDQEIELPEFPFYLKEGEDKCYKIYSEDECILLKAYDFSTSIEDKYPTALALDDFENSEIITEEEFKEFYKMVLTKIEKNL